MGLYCDADKYLAKVGDIITFAISRTTGENYMLYLSYFTFRIDDFSQPTAQIKLSSKN